ncbi:MAG: phage major capsid protein, partial [Clostridia bacterium]|nr:phage major capsid protein [Clostridia bacterium]
LQVGELSEGGYTVPDEFEHTLVQALEEDGLRAAAMHAVRAAYDKTLLLGKQ